MLKLFLGPKVSLRKETLYAQYRALIEYPNSLTINEIALGYKMKINLFFKREKIMLILKYDSIPFLHGLIISTHNND